MKSIQSKIIALIIVGIIVSSTLIGGVGVCSFNQVISNDSANIMNLTCKEKAQELDNVLGRIEQSVEILSVYAIDNLESVKRLSQDAAYMEQYTKTLADLGLTIANKTEGAVAVYARYNPGLTRPKAGFFKVKNVDGRFEDWELTDFSKYNPDDVEHVGWYYIPVQEGKAVWMQPYYNQNIDIYMISYVIPIYKQDTLIGIVGMDIDFNYITAKSDGIKVYRTGDAFLMDGHFNIIHSKSYQKGTKMIEFSKDLSRSEAKETTNQGTIYNYTWEGVRKKVAFYPLANDMVLGVTAPVSEIDRNKKKFVLEILVIELLIALLFIILAWAISKTIVKPLQDLNVAAREIADGNLDISLNCKSKDEVGTLTESLKETAHQLKVRIDYINNLAYMDKLTGVQNNTSYLHRVAEIKDGWKDLKAAFALFVVDVNGLKYINDNYGHDQGNQLIMAASEMLSEIFGRENVYRIGGDEFAVIVMPADSGQCWELEQRFHASLKNQTGNITLSAAIGSAIYDTQMDKGYEDVFRRADGAMYQNKTEMKAKGETSTVNS